MRGAIESAKVIIATVAYINRYEYPTKSSSSVCGWGEASLCGVLGTAKLCWGTSLRPRPEDLKTHRGLEDAPRT